ncbi:protein argonaute [Marinitoga sp. 1155]|uniref:protein argonaute n=1 Tax=Marinitoga sp. 1155 TaxID=1428448 RepID=UPI000640CA2D|nr:hypothetical protein [Marinitoga sp. 1155]KLO23509.1 hypothetical protein X274_06355 [Marinitoga sp. 1155]
MYLNLYEIKTPYRVKRLYYFNKDNDPKEFARNLSRVNNIRFNDSNDLVWLEIPDIDFKITPQQAEKYRIEKNEIIEEKKDPNLFIKTIYKYLKKKFIDNNFYYKRGNNYISINDKFPLDSNTNVNAHLTYKIKLHKIDEKYYISILPKFTFLSDKAALESPIKSAYLFNIKSGKSFPYISGLNGILKIDLGDNGVREVSFPGNYYFNFTSKEAEKFGFSKEIHNIYKEKLLSGYKKIKQKLYFLEDIININNYNLTMDKKTYVNIEYEFKKGKSRNIKDVFKYSFYKNDQKIKIAFFFSSKKQIYEIQHSLKILFQNKNSIFYQTIYEMGFSKVIFLREPKTKSSAFMYDPETFEISNKDFFENLEGNIMAIVILDKFLGNIDPLIQKFPENLILQPILKEKLEKIQPYIIKSYVYKMGNFIQECQPYVIRNLKDKNKTLYIGIDLSHDNYLKKSNLAISAVNNFGDIIYLNKYKNLELNEKMNLDIVEKEYIQILNEYYERNKNYPENIIVLRDGRYLEDIDIIKNILNIENIKYSLIEVNKSVNINSYEDLKEWIIKLSDNNFIYYPKTYFNQKGVEIKIIENNTDYDNEKILEQVYSLTRVVHPTPYVNYRLPYPLQVVNKVALTELEWKLYIPYMK